MLRKPASAPNPSKVWGPAPPPSSAPTRRGPIGDSPELLTSLPDFERIYGSAANLALGGGDSLNYLAHGVRNYFDNGGSRLYVMRAFAANSAKDSGIAGAILVDNKKDSTKAASVNARAPGAAYCGTVSFTIPSRAATGLTLSTAPQGSLLKAVVSKTATLFVKKGTDWLDSSNTKLTLPGNPGDTPGDAGSAASLLGVSVQFTDADGYSQGWDDLGLDSNHPRYLGTRLAQTPQNRVDQLQNLICVAIGGSLTAFDLYAAITALAVQDDGSYGLTLAGGNDGAQPSSGDETTVGSYAATLAVLSGLEDISIVAAPGASALDDAQAIQNGLIAHAEKRRAYRIAVLDCAAAQTPSQMAISRGQIDSKYAALYYPWVIVSNPLAKPGRDDIPKEIALPPSGFVTGIYARNDTQRGVYKAPANEVVTGALRFESDINFAQQELLNPIGVNCLRYMHGRGYRLWGARLASSDPEWKYVSDRRYFNYLEASIDRGTQWAVFEPNGERLWANIRQTIADFLYNEWKNGALLGTSADQAYFVRCDRSTMTQSDLDNGRLICLIGVAIIKPAEFVIFRIGQKTADAQN